MWYAVLRRGSGVARASHATQQGGRDFSTYLGRRALGWRGRMRERMCGREVEVGDEGEGEGVEGRIGPPERSQMKQQDD